MFQNCSKEEQKQGKQQLQKINNFNWIRQTCKQWYWRRKTHITILEPNCQNMSSYKMETTHTVASFCKQKKSCIISWIPNKANFKCQIIILTLILGKSELSFTHGDDRLGITMGFPTPASLVLKRRPLEGIWPLDNSKIRGFSGRDNHIFSTDIFHWI